jgi:ribosomal protein S27AE
MKVNSKGEDYMGRNELYKGLSKEQVKKAKACKSHEELLALAKEEGIELNNEQLQAISGGGLCSAGYEVTCPNCDSLDVEELDDGRYKCGKCHKVFED